MKWKLPYIVHDYTPPEKPHVITIPVSSSSTQHNHTLDNRTPLPQEAPPTSPPPLSSAQHAHSSFSSPQMTASPLPVTLQTGPMPHIPRQTGSTPHVSHQTGSTPQISNQAGLPPPLPRHGSSPPPPLDSSVPSPRVHKSAKHKRRVKPPTAPSSALARTVKPDKNETDESSSHLKNSLPPLRKAPPKGESDTAHTTDKETRTSKSDERMSGKSSVNSENNYSTDEFDQASSAESTVMDASSLTRLTQYSSRDDVAVEEDRAGGLFHGGSNGKASSSNSSSHGKLTSSASHQRLAKSRRSELLKSASSAGSHKSLKSEKQLPGDAKIVGRSGSSSELSLVSGLSGFSDISSNGDGTGVASSSTSAAVKPSSSNGRESRGVEVVHSLKRPQLESQTGSSDDSGDRDSLSICSVSEMSRTRYLEGEKSVGGAKEEEEEEIEEDLEEVTDEDTMFEETLQDYEGREMDRIGLCLT